MRQIKLKSKMHSSFLMVNKIEATLLDYSSRASTPPTAQGGSQISDP